MLFSVLAIITNYDYSNYKEKVTKTKIQKVVTETINSILFEAFICILLLLYSIVIIVLNDTISINMIVNKILTGIACFLFTVLLMNLLIVIKRLSKTMIIKINDDN